MRSRINSIVRSAAPLPLLLAVSIVALLAVSGPRAVRGDCPFCYQDLLGPGDLGPNVRWRASDSLAACPAGDSVVVYDALHFHPARLRVGVEYFDSECTPKAGVPPDSIWMTYTTGAGNVVVNDKGTRVFADDSTDGCGFARITIPSLSGCGVLTMNVYVSGVYQGSQAVIVRSTDTDANGRILSGDASSPCDLNYDGVSSGGDSRGERMPCGIYLWRLEAGSLRQEGKVVIVR
jgi:hypothetical protein